MTHALHAVLVVEDDDDSRDALVAVLEAYGYVVCEATDGQDALDR
jgi:CheY-like chemotaxis protein